MRQRPEITERKARTILLNGVGWTARKNPAAGKLFFLDSFYRTNQASGIDFEGITSESPVARK
jgi:hypothetical protein